MQKLTAFVLALGLSVAAIGALAAAWSGFPCDFVRVARPQAPACAPERPLVSFARPSGGGMTGS